MSDRTTEIREALRRYDEWGLGKDALGRYMAVAPLADAARAYADLLDSDALIIQRDENGEWPDDVVDRVGPILNPYPGWEDPDHYKASLVVLREATLRTLDDLAAVVDTPKEKL